MNQNNAGGVEKRREVCIVYVTSNDNKDTFENWLNENQPSSEQLKDYDWIIAEVESDQRPKTSRHEDDMKPNPEEYTSITKAATGVMDQVASKLHALKTRNNTSMSQKDARKMESDATVVKLKDLSADAGLTSGKWMWNVPADEVDIIWRKVAKAVIDENGALRNTVYRVKVSNIRSIDANKPPTHSIYVYTDDAWNKKAVGDVLHVLVSKVGVIPTWYRPDIYSAAGLEGPHPTKLRTTLYGKLDFMSREENELARLAIETSEGSISKSSRPETLSPARASQPSPKLTRKTVRGTGFVDSEGPSDSEERGSAKKARR